MPLKGRQERTVCLVLAFVNKLRIAVLKNVAIKTETKISYICYDSVWRPIFLISLMLISRMIMLNITVKYETKFEGTVPPSSC